MSFKALSEKIDFELVKELSKLTPEQAAMKAARDKELHDIIEGKDDRILLVIGPCSAHDEEAVMEYVRRLAKLQEQVKDKVFMVPRIYTNKPRTTGDGYKGLLHKQDPTGKSNLIQGIAAVRSLHNRVITETGLTTADEMLYPENLDFVDDLVSYHAIGARSVEDQQHRFAWVPFGGGTRRCVGAAFANMEMDIVLRTVLRQFTVLTTDAPGEKRHSRGVAFTPAMGGRVVVYRRR